MKAPWLWLVGAWLALATVPSCGIKFGELGTSVVQYKKCEDGKHFFTCEAEYTRSGCGCDPTPIKRDWGFCFGGTENQALALLEDGLLKKIASKITSSSCIDSGSADIPSGGLKPLAWGDDKCSACVASHCPVERENCDADALCTCLDQCQAAYPDLQGQITASRCGCAAGELDAYNDLLTCVHDPLEGCVDECWPSSDACTCN